MSLSPEFLNRVDALYQEFIEFDAKQTNRIDRYRNIEPESAQYLSMLVRIQQSQQILEIGTSTGYSTLWLADAAKTIHAKITTLEIDPQRSAQAQAYARALKLDQVIDFLVVDALDFIQDTAQRYDLILLDAERDAYVEYWQSLQTLLNPQNGVLVVDNVISHAEQVKDFIKMIQDDLRFQSQIIPIGAGLLMVTPR